MGVNMTKSTVYPEAVTLRVSRVNDKANERPVIGDRRERFARAIESLSTIRRDNAADYSNVKQGAAPIAGGPRSSVWAVQSGAAQAPFMGDNRIQCPPTFPGKVSAPTLAPVNRRGRASVSDSPPTIRKEPRASLRFASEGRRTRLASMCASPVLNEEEGATERPYPPPGHGAPAPVPAAADPVVTEWNRQHREAIEDNKINTDRRRALLPLPPAPKCLPRPARPGAPTPRHGIQSVVSASGRDLDPGRKR
jgi:hypothetical protein